MKSLLNIVLYQLTWLAAVVGAGYGYWWSGLAMLAVFAAVQLSLSKTRAADVQLMLIAAGLGFMIDSAFAGSGLLRYSSAVPWTTLAPVWIVALWMSFALTMNHSMAFLRGRPLLAALFGGIGGPLAYLVAARSFAAVRINGDLWQALLILAVSWAVATPILTTLASLLVGRRIPHSLSATGAR